MVRTYFPGARRVWVEEPIFDERVLPRAIPEGFNPMLFARLCPRADIILEFDKELVLLEFSDRARVSDVGKLLIYIDAMRHDKLRPEWRTKPIRPVFVTPYFDSRVADLCAQLGVDYIAHPYAVS